MKLIFTEDKLKRCLDVFLCCSDHTWPRGNNSHTLIFTEILSVNFDPFNSKLRQACLIVDLGSEDSLREIQSL